MADEDIILEEAMDDLREAGQRIRATQSLMRSERLTDGEDYRGLLTRLSTALAMTEAAYLEAVAVGISNQSTKHSTPHAVNEGKGKGYSCKPGGRRTEIPLQRDWNDRRAPSRVSAANEPR